jgi:hypothetical protein
VTINANSSIKKVQVVACIDDLDEDKEAVQSLKVLNEAELGGATSVTLTYDAPNDNKGLFVAFISDNSYKLRKINGATVSLETANARAFTRANRALPAGVTLPTGEFIIKQAVESYEHGRSVDKKGTFKGFENEWLYSLDDYTAQKMSIPEYSDEYLETFRAMVFSYFQNKAKNLPLVKSSGMYNGNAYCLTTGDDPIIISPNYKRDGADKYGNEVYNSELYYYYFSDNDIKNMSEEQVVAYLKALPKYKAIPFNEVFQYQEDDKIGKRCAYALMYFGEGTPVVGETKGSYYFPQGLKIGFMLRSNSDTEGGKKKGELYLDGRLNGAINTYSWTNFRSSNLGEDGPRAAWLTLEGKMMMCWESGTDSDFNDLILEVEGGVKEIVVEPIPETIYNVYTYCFEDTKLGDYDLNDVVIKATRKNDTTVEYAITACGAWDELYIKNINSGVVTDDKEVHSLFGVTNTKTFINTEKGKNSYDAVKVTKTVPSSFSLTDPTTQPYIYNKTNGLEVRISKQGEDPHGIMIPNDFKYPTEKTCIKNAYAEFNNWGVNPVISTDWYTDPVTNMVYSK